MADFPDITPVPAWEKTIIDSPQSKISHSLKRYTEEGFAYLNNHFRKNPELERKWVPPDMRDKHLIAHIKNINEAFKHAPSHEGGILYRGFPIPNENKYKRNRTYIHKGYLSTSLERSTAHYFAKSYVPQHRPEGTHAYFMKLKVPSNHPVLNLMQVSQDVGGREAEHLLPHNTKFKVTHVIKQPNFTEVHAEVLPIKPKKSR